VAFNPVSGVAFIISLSISCILHSPEYRKARQYAYTYSRLVAKLTSLLKSPKALGVGVSLPSSTTLFLEVVGENIADELGVIPLEGVGSISMDVRNEESWRSALEDVTERKMSRSFCWSFRGVPFRSRIWG